MNDGDECARCGGTIDDDAEVVLIVYEADERGFDPHDPGPVLASYCETCTRAIEKEHKRHDEDVKAFRDGLERSPFADAPWAKELASERDAEPDFEGALWVETIEFEYSLNWDTVWSSESSWTRSRKTPTM